MASVLHDILVRNAEDVDSSMYDNARNNIRISLEILLLVCAGILLSRMASQQGSSTADGIRLSTHRKALGGRRLLISWIRHLLQEDPIHQCQGADVQLDIPG